MSADSNHPDPKDDKNRTANKTDCWQRTPTFLSWLCKSFANTDNLPGHLTALFTFLLAVFACYAWDQATRGTRAMQGQLKAANDQLTLTFPPQLRITNVVIFQDGDILNHAPPKMISGDKIDGIAFVINTGREHAEIKETTCITFWHNGQLPMYRPYNDLEEKPGKSPRQHGDCTIEITNTLETGQAAEWHFASSVPAKYDQATFFYFLGNVVFYDRLGTRHIVLFARKYDPSIGRFVAEKDNPDYESVE